MQFYFQNPSFCDTSEDTTPSFEDYGLEQHLKDALKTMNVKAPTKIQVKCKNIFSTTKNMATIFIVAVT